MELQWDLSTLQNKTYDLWQDFHDLTGSYFEEGLELSDNPAFLNEVGTYGPLDQQETWEAAYVALRAKFMAHGCPEDGQYFVEFYLITASKRWGWRPLLPRVLSQLEMFPEAVEEIEDGLRKIGAFGLQYGTDLGDFETFKELLIDGNSEKWRGLLESGTPIAA